MIITETIQLIEKNLIIFEKVCFFRIAWNFWMEKF
jgi:hypothetical protein